MIRCRKCSEEIGEHEIGAVGNHDSLYCNSCTNACEREQRELIDNYVKHNLSEPGYFMRRYLRMVVWGIDPE